MYAVPAFHRARLSLFLTEQKGKGIPKILSFCYLYDNNKLHLFDSTSQNHMDMTGQPIIRS